MKFAVDAQLPRRLCHELAKRGHDCVHTLDLALGNRTPDHDLTALAIKEGRLVVTKDNDFVVSFLLHGIPPKLLLISTGNIDNDTLSRLLEQNLPALETAFQKHNFVELSATTLIVHV